MTQPWSAEERISPERAAQLIEAQFPRLAPVRLSLLGEGWDNLAFLVDDTWVFRFPRRQIAVGLLERERTLLPLVARHVPLQVPVPEFEGQPSETFRWPFLGYRLLPGRTLCTAQVTEAQRAGLVQPLAAFLRSLHAIPLEVAKAHGATPHFIDKLSFDRIVPPAERHLTTLREKGVFTDSDPLLAELRRPMPVRDAPPVLCHGDVYARHLVVDEHARLTGVIDWGDVHVGEAAVDLLVAHLVLPRALHAEFRRHYGPVSEGAWQLARLAAIFHASATGAYSVDIGDADLLRESLWALRELSRA